ncbi:UV-stimulated scaffold protein A-like, partial [Callorhinchus milii]|uniref:UV-stimulated scaffold protein A-like n=1 Tax=Callorhinchus milii TaxID=7868 RepID=UPI001C3F88FF
MNDSPEHTPSPRSGERRRRPLPHPPPSPPAMELQQCERLSQLVEDLTTSGEPTLNSEKMKELKKVCKSSEDYIKQVYHLLMTQLNKDHAEIRLSAFQIVNKLFARSHQFRTLLVSDFQEFLELTVETDYDQPLPPPKEVAQKLKRLAIKSVQEWQEKYGDAYKKLSLGYHFLKHIKQVDFQDIRARTQAERKREEERQRRLENINKVKVKRVEEEMAEMTEEMQNCLTELEACFHFLMPHLDEFTINGNDCLLEQEVTDETDQSNCIASGQQGVHPHCMDLFDDEQPCSSKDFPPLPSVKITPENQALGEKTESPQQDGSSESEEFESTTTTTTRFHLRGVEEKPFVENSSDEENEETFIRNHGLVSHKYFLNLEIDTGLKVREDEDNTAVVSNIKDFERLVTKKYLPTVKYWIQIFTKAGVHDVRLKQAIDLKNAMETAVKKHEEMNISYKNRNRKVLVAWGQIHLTCRSAIICRTFQKGYYRVDCQHSFWSYKEEEGESENNELAAMLKTRYITFAGEFQPVNHKCQAPMPDGTLCQRQDRLKVYNCCFKITSSSKLCFFKKFAT